MHRQPYAVAPWSPLPDSSEAYLATLTSQFRRQMRKASARLAAEDVVHRTHRGPSARRSLDTLRQLHQAQWGRRSRFLSHFDRFAAACALGAEVDEVVVHELASEELVVATVVTFEVAGRVSLYQSARRTESHWREAMSVLLTTIITDACDRGLAEVDLCAVTNPTRAASPRNGESSSGSWRHGEGAGRAAKAATIAASTTRRAAERAVQARRRAQALGRRSTGRPLTLRVQHTRQRALAIPTRTGLVRPHAPTTADFTASTGADCPGGRGVMCRRRRRELRCSILFCRRVAVVKYVKVIDAEIAGPLCTQCGTAGGM